MASKIKNPVERLPEHIYGLEGDYSIIPNPFAPLLPLVLLVLSLTIMLLVDEINRSRLTEDEVEDRVREVHRAKELGKPLTKEVVVREGTVYVVGEYDCPHCKKHYLIKCNGKKDWVE